MSGQSVKILVVDDIPSARRVLVRMLSGLGYSAVEEAGSVKEATDKLEASPFGLVITDMHLRDGKGIDILKLIESKYPSLPAIIVTSDMDKNTFDEASKIRVTGYLLKPFSTQSLDEKLKILLK